MKIVAEWDEEVTMVPADHKIPYWSKRILEDRKPDADFLVRIAAESQVRELQCQVIRGNIKPEELVFIYKGQELIVDKDAHLSSWPKGFAEISERQCREILEGIVHAQT